MMTNLFTIFDPSTKIFNINLSLNWMSMILLFFIFPSIYWITPNIINIIQNMMINNMMKEYKTILKKKNYNFNLICSTLFLFILINNFMGLYPFIFTSTSQVVVNLTISIPLWLGMMTYGIINQTKKMLIHLVPQGTPNNLIPFMVMIETISNLIRPITLIVRLTANMVAGHLLLTLLGNMGNKLNLMEIPFLIFIQMLLLTLESAVAIIQSYVFAILMTLYISEI